MKFRFILTGVLLGLLSVAAFAADTPQAMSISCKSPNPDPQSGLHRIKGDSDMWTFAISLEGGARFVDGPYWSYPGKGGNDPDWGMWTDGKDGDSSLGWSSPQKTGSFGVGVNGQIVCGDGNGGEPIDFAAGWDGDILENFGISFEGSLQAVAGHINSSAHKIELKVTLTDKANNNVAVPDHDVKFYFEGNVGDQHEAEFINNSNNSSDDPTKEVTLTTDEEGKIYLTILSGDTVTNDVKVKSKYKTSEGSYEELDDGQVDCNFVETTSERNFPIPSNMDSFPGDNDNGWWFNADVLISGEDMTAARLYLKYEDESNNLKSVNGHTIRITIDDITPKSGYSQETNDELYVYFCDKDGDALLESNGDLANHVDVTTGGLSSERKWDPAEPDKGVATLYLKAGPLIYQADTISLKAEDQTQVRQ